MAGEDKIQYILKYWHKLEAFSPYDYAREEEKIYHIYSDRDLPWLKKERETQEARFYKIYIGILPVAAAMETVRRVLKDEAEEVEELTGETCFGTFLVDENGVPVKDSLQLSMLPWAVGQLCQGYLHAKDWHASFQDYYERIGNLLYSKFNKTCQVGSLRKLIAEMENHAGWTPEWERLKKPLALFTIKKRQATREDEENSILNSFFIKDLERVQKALAGEGVGPALKQYLGYQAVPARIDMVKDTGNLKRILSPRNIPLGRWPSEPRFSLYLMQQAAVNLAVQKLSGGQGLFSVNGPPGTGKTTLLRDVIAAVITQRAGVLATYEDPLEAFTYVKTFAGDGYSLKLFRPDRRITGYEILVASSNNKAVENISRELPNYAALAFEYHDHPDADYFREVARSVYGPNGWGMLAAVLGNRANRHEFVHKFWFAQEDSQGGNCGLGMLSILKRTLTGPVDWRKAREEFYAARQKVIKLLHQAIAWETANRRLVFIEKLEQRNEYRFTGVFNEISSLQVELQKITAALETAHKDRNNCLAELNAIKATRPGFLLRIFNPGLAKKYDQSVAACRDRLDRTVQNIQQLEVTLNKLQQRFKVKETTKLRYQKCRERLHARRKKYEAAINTGRNIFGDTLPDKNFWSQSPEEVQLRSPFAALEFNRARAELFLASLKVHRVFIEVARDCLRNNLGLFMDYLSGKISPYELNDALLDLWQTFFLVVPVVSTTFASVGSMFRGLNGETLGWLIIDEAGQATPQSAVGALWRFRRALIVGDPLQVEPVFPVPQSISKDLREYYSLDARWDPACTSVQVLADLANPYGAMIRVGGENCWIGCPLRVHRRCIDPMFSLANAIAYNGLMVSATPQPQKTFPLGESRWIHVEGVCKGRQWVPEQGKVALILIARLVKTCLKNGDGPPSLYIISPFREVAVSMRSHLKQCLVGRLASLPEEKRHEWLKWIKDGVGTVHTFQGQEADAVLLVLGADHNKPGAIAWAARKPNILNVAITRGRYRLYIIGDGKLWGRAPYFQYAYRILPVREVKLQK